MKPYALTRSALALLCGLILIAFSLVLLANTPASAHARSAIAAPTAICFVGNDIITCVNRPALSAPATITDEIESLTRWLLVGPTSSEQKQGVASSLPSGTQLDQASVIDNQVTLDLILPDAALKTLTDQQVEDIHAQFRTTFTPYNFQRIQINARGSRGEAQLLSDFLPKIEIPRKESPSPALAGDPLKGAGGQGGGLQGKTVFVSAGHGWAWNTTFNTYRTQRPMYPSWPYPSGEGIIEDFNNAEVVNQYLLPYLQNAGADAWTVRERDMNTQLIIVDDNSADFSAQGDWTSNSGGYNGTYRSMTTITSTASATATWTFTPAITATYAVYVRFPSITATRTVDARFFIDRAGAITPITLTQARDSNNWRFIGNFPFDGGQAARITLTNQSSTPGVTVLADAVRIGGGIGDTSVAGAPISNKPRWEEQSRQYAKWAGLPNVDDTNDVIVRPIYSEWEKEAGEDAVYISWHTNGYTGFNTTARGTETYIHSFEPTTNSNLLQNYVHAALLADIHTGWEATWPDRGKKSLDLGELRLLDSMPGVLIENGYHDNPTDVEAMKDPRFLQLSARAVYHGLVNYWHAIDPSVPLNYLPEPPQQVIMRNNGEGSVTIAWQPGPTDGNGPLGDAATSYRVYLSTDGFGWSNPIDVATMAYTLTGLSPHQLMFAKVTGVNAGGESFASPVLAARAAFFDPAHVLIVYGFDRIDRLGDIRQNDPPEGYSRRVFIDRINRFDAIIQHAEVITLPFDSAQPAAVSSGSIGLGAYTIVDWIAGENQTPFPALAASDQSALTNFLNGGGALFISGSEIGYELQGTPFYATTLRAAYVADDAQTYTANSTAGGLFNGLGAINFDDGSHGMYDVDYADVVAPVNGAASALVYNTASAAVQYADGCTRLVYAGIPFETIYPRATRQSMMSRLIGFLGVCLPPAQATSKTYLPLILNSAATPPEPVCSDSIVNGSFESGDFTGWTRPSQNPPGTIVTFTVFSGSYAARIGALTIADPITTTAYSSVKQSVSIPAQAITATLSLARYRWSGDTNGDRQYLAVLRPGQPPVYLFSDGTDDAGWNSASFDMLSYAGQTIELLFSVLNDGAGGSSGMALDAVQLQMCIPQ